MRALNIGNGDDMEFITSLVHTMTHFVNMRMVLSQ